jgi:hypothetical protein
MLILLTSFIALHIDAMHQQQAQAKTKADIEFEQTCKQLPKLHEYKKPSEKRGAKPNEYTHPGETLFDAQKRLIPNFVYASDLMYIPMKN